MSPEKQQEQKEKARILMVINAKTKRGGESCHYNSNEHCSMTERNMSIYELFRKKMNYLKSKHHEWGIINAALFDISVNKEPDQAKNKNKIVQIISNGIVVDKFEEKYKNWK